MKSRVSSKVSENEERGVLPEVASDPLPASMLDRKPVHVGVPNLFDRTLAFIPKTDDINRIASVRERFDLTTDAHIVRVIGVHDHGESHRQFSRTRW